MTDNLDHVLLVGPPGTGKTRWARKQSVPTELTRECDAEMPYIYRAAQLGDRIPSLMAPPFRAPHHTVSLAGLVGTVRRRYQWQPGEFSLAHGGILLLDELPEFRRQTIMPLREALRDGMVSVSGTHTRYPAKFRLIATANECPCGYYGTSRKCDCSESRKRAYLGRIPEWLRPSLRVVRRAEYETEVAS
jgi:magnesium chelatase family protein